MKQKKFPLRLIALILTAALLCSGCVVFPTFLTETTAAKPTAETGAAQPTSEPTAAATTDEPIPTTEALETTEPAVTEDEALIRWQNGGSKDFLPDEPVQMVSFHEMEYVRPDMETLYADFDALTERAAESEDAAGMLEEFYDLYQRYISFDSMDTLANILYSLDTTDPYYQEEYDYCELERPNLEEKFEALNKAFAASPSRNELEALYFGEGYFEKYDDYEVYTNPEYLRLSQEEAALLTEYRDLTADIQVTFNNVTKSLDEWLESTNYYEYIGALRAYYDQYNASIGDVYVRLIKVRQQLAQTLDYETYAEYSYDVTYGRDYTPEQGSRFISDIREYLLPVMEKCEKNTSLSRLDFGDSSEEALFEMVGSAAEKIGGSVWDAYRFMLAYDLCDISKSANKIEASFMAYLYDYEAPFVLLNATGSGRDYVSFSHEFGHFTDAYHNYGANEDLETAETFSQAMEFLALTYSEGITDTQRNDMLKLEIVDLLQTFVYQAAYAEFEARVYALDPDEITVEKINDVYRQCCKDFGFYENGFDFYYSMSWIDVLHFFQVPNYIISYCVSAETALQVYQLESQEYGAGVEAYFRLLDRDYEAGVQQVMEDAGLANPFRDGVIEETAEFFTEKLKLK